MRGPGADLRVLISLVVAAVIGSGVALPELVEHTGPIHGISASGKRATVHAANFRPAGVAHDVPPPASP